MTENRLWRLSKYTLYGIMWMFMNNLSATVKMLRKQYGLTQEELSLKSGVGLRFVRDLEQGKETLRLDKVNQLLDFFNYEMVAILKTDRQ